MADKLKLLTGRNPADFEPVAYSLINDPDVELFKQLVDKDDYLFDFVKENVAKRLAKVCNEKNYSNLLKFLKYYSPSYEEFIVSILVKYADDDLTDKLLEIFEFGDENEKTYCAKFFSYVQDSLAIELLKQNAYSKNIALSSNCIGTLSLFGDRTIFDDAVNMLKSEDDFVILDGVRMLVSYGDISAADYILPLLKSSALAENIASELLYLCDFKTLLNRNYSDALYVLNLIIGGLGETVTLAQVFDFQIYESINFLLSSDITSQSAVVLIHAKDKFETLTENDEYLFDELKDVKQEVFEIKKLLSSLNIERLSKISDAELNPESLFVYTVLEFSNNVEKIRALLGCQNQTVILKAVEVLKSFKILTQADKDIALSNVNDENIRSIITVL